MFFSCFAKKRTKRRQLKGRFEQMRPLKKPQPLRLKRSKWVILWRCGRERYIGEGGFGARERDTQRLSYDDFFGSFLVRTQERNT